MKSAGPPGTMSDFISLAENLGFILSASYSKNLLKGF